MDLNTFKNDEELIQYLKGELEKIDTLNECRLFKEEQLQLSEEILHFRNCIEWIIRSNQVIINIKYALTRCLEFVESMSWPLEETENKRLYSYYLEDAVYRNLVLWDMLRQLLNEFFKCGYSESDNVSIFKFLREKKSEIGTAKVDRILNHLNSSNHKMVRETLRNSFTHSVEATSSYVFHRNVDGKNKPQMDYLLPSHPFENLNFVTMDILQLIEFISEIVNEMYEYRNTNLILLKVVTVMPCGKVIDDSEHWNLRMLNEKYEQIIVPCDIPCDKAHTYNGAYVCKPIKVNYQRIHSKQEATSGTFTPSMTFGEMETTFGVNEQ
jgi:hypothetical protein